MKIQNTEWGYIEWKHTYDENNPKQAMNIYIAVTMPGKKHFNHVHYGQEQMIYIFRGRGFVYYKWGLEAILSRDDFLYRIW